MWQHSVKLKCHIIWAPPATAQPSYPPQVWLHGSKSWRKACGYCCAPSYCLLPSFPLLQTRTYGRAGEYCSTRATRHGHTYFGTLGTALFPSFFPTQLRFVAVHWTVGFPGLQGTDGCLVSENRTNSLPRLSLGLLLRSDQHSTLMAEEQKRAERREPGSKSDKARMLREAG